MTRGERIAEARRHWQCLERDRTVLQLCNMIGVSEPTYYNWEGDKTKGLYAENLMKFCQITRFNPLWILEGKGRKMLADDESVSDLLETIDDFTPDEYQALVAHAKLLKSARKSED